MSHRAQNPRSRTLTAATTDPLRGRKRVTLAAMALLGLTSPGCAADPSSTETTFTADELQTIIERLGTLPATPPADPSNRHADDPEVAALGQKFFFEPRYSQNGAVSCATCHDPSAGFQDARANTSKGLDYTGRAAPTVLNAAHGSTAAGTTAWQFWDGRADSQWMQALGPPESPVEMGGTRTKIALLIQDEYRAEYEALFGPMPALRDDGGAPRFAETAMPGTPEWEALSAEDQQAITGVYVNFGKAIAAYERTLVSRESRFDAFYREIAGGADDSDHLTAEEKLGLKLFIGAGECVTCHAGPNFTDGAFYNLAIPQIGPHVAAEDHGRAAGITKLLASEFNCAGPWSDVADKSGCAVNDLHAAQTDDGAFKTPGLRSVSLTAPYMHTGAFATLADVVAHYNAGGGSSHFSGEVDAKIRPLGLDEAQIAALVAFLGALDGAPLDSALVTPPPLPE